MSLLPIPLVPGKDDDDEKDVCDGRDADDDDNHLCPSSPSLSFQAKPDSSPVSFSPFTAFKPTGTWGFINIISLFEFIKSMDISMYTDIPLVPGDFGEHDEVDDEDDDDDDGAGENGDQGSPS